LLGRGQPPLLALHLHLLQLLAQRADHLPELLLLDLPLLLLHFMLLLFQPIPLILEVLEASSGDMHHHDSANHGARREDDGEYRGNGGDFEELIHGFGFAQDTMPTRSATGSSEGEELTAGASEGLELTAGIAMELGPAGEISGEEAMAGGAWSEKSFATEG